VADAGRYVLVDLFWDERTNEYDKPVPIFKRHVKGEVLDLDEAEATRLVEAGSVEPEGQREARELELARARLRVALAQYPDDLRPLVPSDEELDELARRETPIEELHVHHPDEASSTVAALDATQASLDDGGKDTRNARSAQGARRRADVEEQAKRADVQAPVKQVPAKADRDNN
jgi:hypothetical protein